MTATAETPLPRIWDGFSSAGAERREPPAATVTRADLIAARDDAAARFARDGVETDAEIAQIVGAELDR